MLESEISSLWSSEILNNVNKSGQYFDGLKVKTELSYGVELIDGTSILTPFGSIDFSENSIRWNNKLVIPTNTKLIRVINQSLVQSPERLSLVATCHR